MRSPKGSPRGAASRQHVPQVTADRRKRLGETALLELAPNKKVAYSGCSPILPQTAHRSDISPTVAYDSPTRESAEARCPSRRLLQRSSFGHLAWLRDARTRGVDRFAPLLQRRVEPKTGIGFSLPCGTGSLLPRPARRSTAFMGEGVLNLVLIAALDGRKRTASDARQILSAPRSMESSGSIVRCRRPVHCAGHAAPGGNDWLGSQRQPGDSLVRDSASSRGVQRLGPPSTTPSPAESADLAGRPACRAVRVDPPSGRENASGAPFSPRSGRASASRRSRRAARNLAGLFYKLLCELKKNDRRRTNRFPRPRQAAPRWQVR